ncbi:RNA-binding family protein [Perilla frutescens var. hirtella]|uniref:RNA-binding family protein n=1 Tax=Perilla frutescens var. hirtella TaxID=608512 RepID=A0AAD4J0W5_PERFH|nr:RNA-binding family protein [Perilla frutescens var. hirtella]
MAHPPPYEPFYMSALPPEYNYATGDRNGINTLFVSGFPDDVKAHEIHNLFRRRPGFKSCQLKYTGRGNQVVAFATFVNSQSAMAALHSLNLSFLFEICCLGDFCGDGGEVASAAAGPPAPLDWKFSQVFGERTAGEEVQKAMLISR